MALGGGIPFSRVGPGAPRALLLKVAPWLLRGAGLPVVGQQANDDHVPNTPTPTPQDGILILPNTRVLRLVIDPRTSSDGAVTAYDEPMEFQYEGEVGGRLRDRLFTIQNTVPFQTNARMLVPSQTRLGDASLKVYMRTFNEYQLDTLVATYTIRVVPGLAVTSVLRYSIDSGTEQEIPSLPPLFNVPLNKTALLRIAGYDDQGREVDVENVAWTPASATEFTLAQQVNPKTALLTPLIEGLNQTIFVTFDASVPGGEVVTLQRNAWVFVKPAAADTYTSAYAVEWP